MACSGKPLGRWRCAALIIKDRKEQRQCKTDDAADSSVPAVPRLSYTGGNRFEWIVPSACSGTRRRVGRNERHACRTERVIAIDCRILIRMH